MSTKPNPAPRSGPRAQAPVRRPVQTSARPVHFLLTDAYLVAANNGRHLTQLGFNALCRISRSAKDTMKQSSHQVEERLAKPEQLEAIRERWLDAFEANPERMARDATREAELAARLQDELLNELMRNANDAAAALLPNGRAMMLGRIGQGFRSVLSITDQPRVHSGDISFAFDPRRALKAIKKRLGRQTPAEIPVFRLPFPVSHKDEPAPIRAMIEEYDTVVVMPFRSLKACERCRAVWDAKRNDVTLLKSLPALNLMIWERNDATAHYKRTVRDNVDRSVRPAPRIQRPARVELTVGGANSNSKPVIDMSGPRSETDSRVMTRARPGPGVRVSAEIVRHPKNGSSANAPAKTNGAAAPAGRKSAKPKKTSTSAKTRNGTNGASSSSSKPKIETSATTARVAVSEKGTKSTAKKPAAKKPAAKKPA
ncbi:MAG: hypothetical protein MPJ78_09265, partial [Hyphomicrobiaceae bacterium]|nr:hypothetical protein [Hyphomicrobiaceae bacterium]